MFKSLSLLKGMDLRMEENMGPCPYCGSCGGCSIQELPYPSQLAMKEAALRETFGKILAVDSDELPFSRIIPSPRRYYYRNKMEFSFDTDQDGRVTLGQHSRKDKKSVIPIHTCLLFSPVFPAVTSCVLEFANREHLSVFDYRKRKGFLRHLVLREAKFTRQLLINIVTTVAESPDWSMLVEALRGLKLESEIVGILWTINERHADVVDMQDQKVLYGRDFLQEKIGNFLFKITPKGFLQTNSYGLQVLYETVKDVSGLTGKERVLDLFCGTGGIGIYISGLAQRVLGVELESEAMTLAKENALANKCLNCDFMAGKVRATLAGLQAGFELVILNPPRSGIGSKALERVAGLRPKHIIYVSCSSLSLCQDLRYLLDDGFVLEKIQPVDMFPHTMHMETVAVLRERQR